ncbi:MAG: DUF1028 domain-containing protein [Anaerolineae bacterium]|nr:DUF1028 domain-containing protein [Anaerolineae bacterium]
MTTSATSWHATYSIVARDDETGQMGVAVQTHQLGVGRIVSWMLPGVGAIATQSFVNISYGPIGIAMLHEGINAEAVIQGLVATDALASRRQIGVVDTRGNAAAYTGENCIREAGHYIGRGYSVQANMMTRNTVIDAMRDAYESSTDSLPMRMIAALQAAQIEDGDIRGMQSASLKIVSGNVTHNIWESAYDLRVDEHEQPVIELTRLVRIRQAQLIDQEGHALLDIEPREALAKWKQARELAPDQEELAFWQGVTLANNKIVPQSISIAGRIIAQALDDHPRRDHWLDLIQRLEDCGIIEREGTAAELLAAITAES